MDDFKNLNISVDEIDQYLKKIASNGKGKCEIKNIKTGFYQYFTINANNLNINGLFL